MKSVDTASVSVSTSVRALVWALCLLPALLLPVSLSGQVLFNINFGAPPSATMTGRAAVGILTNDFWNAYRHYEPKFQPGMALVASGRMDKLRLHDGSEASVSVAVTNAPGVWGNSSGDPMFDSYMFSQNGSNITVTLSGLPVGRYHFYLYGHADADVSGEQNSTFALQSGTNSFGPQTPSGGVWKASQPWVERAQYIVFRDVPVGDDPVTIAVGAGPGGIPVLNGLQVLSRGTSPPRIVQATHGALASANTNLMIRQISYDGTVSDSNARFNVHLTAESLTTNEISAPLLEGNVAVVSPELPKGLHIVADGEKFHLVCSVPGVHQIRFQLMAKITRAEPWNTIQFTGPEAAIASVKAVAENAGIELQLMSGTALGGTSGSAERSRISGLLGSDRTLALQWQSKGTEVSRKSLLTVDTTATAEVTPTVAKFQTTFRYEILQAPVPRLKISLPSSHALTRIQGEHIRDWQVAPSGEAQELTVEFIRPVEKTSILTLFAEQTVTPDNERLSLEIPRPLDVQRESGSLILKADDTTLDIESVTGLRQVNAPAGAIAAYKFNVRPISAIARLRRIEPSLRVADRITARLEEMRLLISHALDLTVEKAGIYTLKMEPQPGFTVSEVTGEGLDEWTVTDGALTVFFKSRVLGTRKVSVQLEKNNRDVPEQIELVPLRIAGVTNTTTFLGVASSPGIRLKTGALPNLREIPAHSLPGRKDELLAFATEQPAWKLTLEAEKLPPRVVSEVFNLITVGDGLVGGSATIRYGIINQGVQQFRLSVPPHWRNVEFTGPMIRRKEQSTNIWTITLQDKAWGAYTLLITYDYPFDPKEATLDLSGAHPLDVERETGSLGIMTAANLKLSPADPIEPLRRVDQAELSESDRALCTRPLLLAYKYSGPSFTHSVQVTRFEEVAVLDAVTDRTELTTVLNEEGQLLTQSSFIVKNNQKQFQRFKLPPGAELWSSYVNGQPAKPEKDGEWHLVPLPRGANRDQAFAVEIVYAQKINLKGSLLPGKVNLVAPVTDIPNTYAEWQLFAPSSRRLGSFGGNMTVATGTIYGLREAWEQFLGFYGNLIEHHLGAIIGCFVLGLLVVLMIVAAQRGFKGAVEVIVVFGIVAVLAAMLLPALSKAKARAQRVSSVNNLKQIGLAAHTWAIDNDNVFPPSYDAMMNELSTEKILTDPETGQRYIWVGAGKSAEYPEAILAYSASEAGGREVLFADGSVKMMSQEKFDMAMQRDAIVPRTALAAVPADETLSRRMSEDVSQAAPKSPPSAPLVSNGLTFGGQLSMEQPVTGLPSPVKASVTGVRPIRIEIPRAGQAFSFTKILNTGQEPLRISASVVRLGVYRTFQMVLQVTFFIVGLAAFFILWIQAGTARQAGRLSLYMTIAAGLVLYSVASLLIMWRLLHVGLIIAVPFLLFSFFAWIGYRFWKRRRAARLQRDTELPPETPPAIPPTEPGPVIPLLIATALLFSAFSASAEQADAGKPQDGALAGSTSVVSARYTGSVGEKVATFEATIVVASTSTNQTIPFLGPEVAVQSFKSDSSARLVREDNGLHLLLPDQGEANMTLQFAVKVGGDVTRRQLAFGIPRALASEIDLLIEEPDAEVEFPGAVAFTRTLQPDGTKIASVLGAVQRYEMSWTPRIKRAAEVSATVFVQNATLITIGGGVINTRAALGYQVSQGELKQLQVRIPTGHRVLRVEGEFLRLWEVSGDVLTVDLLKNASPAYTLTVETERPLQQLPASVRVEIPHAIGVKRETGLVGFRGSEEISLSQQTVAELQRVDFEEFQRAIPTQSESVNAYRFLNPDFALSLQAEAVQPQIEAVLKQKVRVGMESAQLHAHVEYTIKRAGIFGLKLALPTGYRVTNISGSNIAQWVERSDNGEPLLEVTLKERAAGTYALACVLAQTYQQAPAEFSVPGIHPLDTEKLTGYITVVAEPGLAVKTGKLEGLAEVPFTEANAPSLEAGEAAQSGLAFKFSSVAAPRRAPWSLSVTTEMVEPWVRAEIYNHVSLTETLISGRTHVKFEIVNAPTREFRLRIPSAFRNVEITGDQIRRRDQTNEEWRIELQGKVRGQYVLVVHWEMPKRAQDSAINLPAIEALGVERETGYIGVVARPPLQVSQLSTTELLTRIDAGELPAWPGRQDPGTVLAYRYLRPGYALGLELKRFSDASVLQALIDSARLITVVADDGSLLTELSLSIRNNGRQHLQVQLPPGSTVWSAFVAGDPVRPNTREGRLLLPLTSETASDAAIVVEVTYVGNSDFPSYSGDLRLISPSFDVPMKNARWEFYLPPDYEYTGFEGSMTKTADTTTTAVPLVQVYSLSDYNEQQRVQEVQQKEEINSGLQAVRKGLSGGNLREAVGNLYRAKSRSDAIQHAQTGQELKEVEEELRRAQSSNIIAAQSEYFYANSARFGGAAVPQAQSSAAADEAVAGLQWERLEKAQQVVAAKVAPLRVNLPTRGVHLSFSQVLQTEVGKPMQVQMSAHNTKAPSWAKRVFLSIASFMTLWLLLILINARRQRQAAV